jgi:hypothetical protein
MPAMTITIAPGVTVTVDADNLDELDARLTKLTKDRLANLAANGSRLAATPAPDGSGVAPSCVHGERTYKTGTSARGDWRAWMCAAGRDAVDKCEPQWI